MSITVVEKAFLQRETWLNVIFTVVTNVMSIVHLTFKITGCIRTIQWFEVPSAWLTRTFRPILRLGWAQIPTEWAQQ